MEETSQATAHSSEDIGARFKAGLQSVLNGLGKSTSPQKPVPVSSDTSSSNGHMNGDVMRANCGKERLVSTLIEPLEICTSDALLGDPEQDDDEHLNDCDDTLLEGGDVAAENSANNPNTLVHKGDVTTSDAQDSNGLTGQSDCNITELGQLADIKSTRPKTPDKSNEKPKIYTLPANEKNGAMTPSLTKTFNTPNTAELSKISPTNAEPMDITSSAFDNSNQNGHTVVGNNVSVEMLAETIVPNSKVDSSETCVVPSADNPKPEPSEIKPETIESKTTPSHFGKLMSIMTGPESVTGSESHVDESTNGKSENETCSIIGVTDANRVTRECSDLAEPRTELPSGTTTSLDKISCAQKTDCTSPEKNRSAENEETSSPPSTQVSPLASGTIGHDRSYTPPIDNELLVEQQACCSFTSSNLEVRNTMDDLLGKTVATVDGNPVTSVRTHRASPHVSPNNSEDEGEDLVIGCTSAEEMSDEDSRGELSAKRPRLSLSAQDDGGGNRLNKLISHLSTTLEGNTTDTASPRDEIDDDHESIHLKKNGLASFYDAIIKEDVVKEAYHKELSRKHQELQIKNNMDCKKITKILQEVKAVREKLKLMNVRPAQRSVSTQIFSEKLQQPPDQPGNRIIKSTVLSNKALAEAQQRMAAEAKREADLTAKWHMELAAKRHAEEQGRKQAELSAKRQADERIKELAERNAKLAVIQTKEQEHIKLPILKRPSAPANLKPQLPLARSPVKGPPSKPPSAGSEVIDLTAEEDGGKVIDKKPVPPTTSITTNTLTSAVTHTPSNTNATNGPAKHKPTTPLNLFGSAITASGSGSPPLVRHPAPLPQCPLTGKPGNLLKPSAPRLELSSKEDGIVLQWNMHVTKSHARVSTYQIFGYKERPGPLSGTEWKKVGDLKALPLPMACTLTQFQTGHTYHFAVRAVDELGRTGPFGVPRSTKLG